MTLKRSVNLPNVSVLRESLHVVVNIEAIVFNMAWNNIWFWASALKFDAYLTNLLDLICFIRECALKNLHN